MKERSKKDYVGLQFIAMSLFIICFLHWAYQTNGNETGLFYGKSIFNILVYVSCVLSVFALYIVLEIVFNYIPCRSEINKVLVALYGFFFIYCIFFLYKLYEKEIEVVAGYELYINSMRQNVPHFFFAFFMFIIIIGLFFSLRGVIQNQFRYLISFSMALICSILTFTYDFFRNSHWGIYHIHAYINSIINVAKLMPYSDINSTI